MDRYYIICPFFLRIFVFSSKIIIKPKIPDMEIAEIVSYVATLFLLISYCFRTVKLRIFQILGTTTNIIFAYMILDQSPSARSIILSNIIYLIINTIQLFNEIKRQRKEKNNL